jgi:hypothetical protein
MNKKQLSKFAKKFGRKFTRESINPDFQDWLLGRPRNEYRHGLRVKAWKEYHEKRIGNPLASRAKVDPAWANRRRKILVKALEKSPQDIKQALKWSKEGRLKKLRAEIDGIGAPYPRFTVYADVDRVWKFSPPDCLATSRRGNYKVYSTFGLARSVHKPHISEKRGYTFRTVQHAVHETYIPAYCIVNAKNDRELGIVLNGLTQVYSLPEGYKWQKGAIIRLSDGADYHPLAWFISSPKTCSLYPPSQVDNWINELDQLARWRVETTRRAEENKRSAEYWREQRNAEKTDCFVTLADSLRAGNCMAGSLGFAREIGINLSALKEFPWLVQVPASKVLELGGERGRLACFAAWERETMVSI